MTGRYSDADLLTWAQAGVAAARLRELRGERSQLWLSRVSGVGISTVRSAETASVRIRIASAELLAAALGTDLQGLTRDTELPGQSIFRSLDETRDT